MTGEDIRALRLKLGLSQWEFARFIGAADQKTISRWEGGMKPHKLYRAILAVVQKNAEKGVYTEDMLARHALGLDLTDDDLRFPP